MNHITLKQVSYDCTDFIDLCNQLDQFLNLAIGGESKREKYKKFNHLDTMDYVVIAYDNNIPIGCAALRKYSEKSIEVKRVFVQEKYRGQHIGSTLLKNLIMYAKTSGYERMLLETGDFLKASLQLYSSYGFERIPNYGAYAGMTESLCMAKDIQENS